MFQTFRSSWWIASWICLLSTAISGSAEERPRWTASKIVGSPEPPPPYHIERILPDIQFDRPVDFALEPSSGLWFVLQLDGKLFALNPTQNGPPQLVHDAKATIEGHNHSYGITFHPDYANNRQVFLSYTLPSADPEGTRVSRFLVNGDRELSINPASEEVIITWPSGGHNGACLKFGADGMLYITAGDGTGPFPPDSANAGQNLADLRSTIMRIDVDHVDEERPYSVPRDNPFVDLPNARPEVWAYGFRNPWKISFDSKTDELWCGDVGWELWELVFRVERAGNYGWSIKEGPQSIRNDLSQGPGEISPPIIEHPHTEAASITGGYVYHGTRFPEFSGKYIYGDYVSGKIWALENEGNRLQSLQELADTTLAIVTFGVDADGELIIVDYGGGLYRIVPNPIPDHSATFPRLLSQTGIFSDTTHLTNETGVVSYWLNTQMWQDGANSSYVIGIPENGSIIWDSSHQRWTYPQGTVFAKTIALSTLVDEVLADRRIETQVLHFDGNDWQPYSYLWNDEQTDAKLVKASGDVKDITVLSAVSEKGLETLQWRVHSRAECAACHVPRAGHVLGFDLPNLERQTPLLKDQLDELATLKILDRPVPDKQRNSVMADIRSTADLEVRARSYLAVNCAHCHRRESGGAANIEFPFEHPTENTRAINTSPTQGSFGIANAKVIAPGDPSRSILYYRMATVGRGHMPQRGANDIDEPGVALIADWIRSMNPDPAVHSIDASQVKNLFDGMRNSRDVQHELKAILASTSSSLQWSEEISRLAEPSHRVQVARAFAMAAPVHLRGLFERFLPRADRSQALGTIVNTAAILELKGDVNAGQRLFHQAEGVTCRNCHVIENRGKSVGPDLSTIGRQRSRHEILESILDPSRKIDAKYVQRTVVTTDGKVFSGILDAESPDGLRIKDVAGNVQFVSRSDIEEIVLQPRSLMPDLLTREMTAQELADLVDYLVSLK